MSCACSSFRLDHLGRAPDAEVVVLARLEPMPLATRSADVLLDFLRSSLSATLIEMRSRCGHRQETPSNLRLAVSADDDHSSWYLPEGFAPCCRARDHHDRGRDARDRRADAPTTSGRGSPRSDVDAPPGVAIRPDRGPALLEGSESHRATSPKKSARCRRAHSKGQTPSGRTRTSDRHPADHGKRKVLGVSLANARTVNGI